jgi:competence protein ComEC
MWICIAAVYVAAVAAPFAAAAALALALGADRHRRRPDTDRMLLLAFALALGRLDAHPPAPPVATPHSSAVVWGWIESTPERDARGGMWCWLRADSLHTGGRAAPAWRRERLRLHAARTLPAYGSRIAARGRLRAATAPRNFGAADARASLRAGGGAAEFDAARWHPDGDRAGPAWRRELLEPLRGRLQAVLESTLASGESGLLAALVLGSRDGVDVELAAAWSALGLTHVLSISGMHVALVASALVAFGGAPCRGRSLGVLLAGVWTYAALGGLGPTVLRAALMATWAAAALYLGRARTPLFALGIASLALVLPAPARRHDLGLQLSCLSTAGLLCWAPVLARVAARGAARGGIWRFVAAAAASAGIGIAAQAATLPLVVSRFGVVAWVSPLANLVAVPWSDAALVLALAGSPLALLCDTLGRPLLLVAGALVHLLTRASLAAVELGETRVFVAADAATVASATLVAAAACAGGIACSAGRARSARACAVAGGAAVVVFAAACIWPRTPSWQVEALDVGQGDATVVRVGSAAWLVDTGDARPADRGARVVVPHLRRSGVRRLRGMVLTHPHRDHCGGADAVLGGVAVDSVYVAAASWDDSSYVALRAAHPHVAWRALARGDRIALAPGVTASVLWPPRGEECGESANECSLVLYARGESVPDLWLMGDLEAAGEAALVAADSGLAGTAARFAILKAGHHGSDTSSTPPFVAALAPEIALVSAGHGNRYRHPGARALATLAAHGCTILRTDRGGAVRIVRRGGTLWLERPAARRVAIAAPG